MVPVPSFLKSELTTIIFYLIGCSQHIFTKNEFKNVTYLDIQQHCIFLHWIQDHIYKFQVLNRFHVFHKILYTLLGKNLYHQVHNLDSRILHWQLLLHFLAYIEWLVLSDMWHIWVEFWHTMCNLWHPEIKMINFTVVIS